MRPDNNRSRNLLRLGILKVWASFGNIHFLRSYRLATVDKIDVTWVRKLRDHVRHHQLPPRQANPRESQAHRSALFSLKPLGWNLWIYFHKARHRFFP